MSDIVKSVKKNISGIDLPLVILIFFLLFSPPIIPKINTAIFAAAVVFFVLLAFHRKELKETIVDSGILKFTIIMAMFYFYVAIITVINYFTGEFVQLMHYITLWYRYFLIVPMLVVCCIYICIRCKKKNYTLYDLSMCYVYAGMIQFVLVLIALLIPAVKASFVDFIYKNTGDIYLGTPWVMERRGFGFSNSFVDSFGFGMGIVAVLPLFFLKKSREMIALFVPCLILVSLVNVRTGLIMAAIGLLFSLPVVFKAFKKSKVKIIAVALASVMLLCVFIGTVYVKNPKTLAWIFEDVVSMVGIDLSDEPIVNIEKTTNTNEYTTENSGDFATTTEVVTTTSASSTTQEQTTDSVAETTTQATISKTSYVESTTLAQTANINSNEETTTEKAGFWQTITTPASQQNTAELLFSDKFWNIPTGLALVFGTGHTIYGAEGYSHSDVGYINDLWMAGIVGCLMLYAAFALLFIKAFKGTKKLNIKCLILFFAAAILVFQVKANAIMFNAGINTILPLLFFICFSEKQKCNSKSGEI